MSELASVFIDVVMPVFGIVLLGSFLGHRLQLQALTLTRAAYFVFVPAFIFDAISKVRVPLDNVLTMVSFIALTHVLAALAAGGIGRMMNRSRQMIAAFVMIAAFGNVGNYGIAVIQFRLGDGALSSAIIHSVAITIVAFVICVSAAGWARGGSKGALNGLLRTPALWAVVPALFVSHNEIAVPLMLTRMIGLLAGAMIPVMLFALGVQLREQSKVELNVNVFVTSAIRLLLVPAIAVAVAIPFGLGQVDYAAGVLQSAMPTAVLVAIISREYDIVPSFVTSVVLVSTLASLITLTVIMVLL
ncbi:MAG: transporter [Desulfuromonas sp.]|nr:MAG: transporter [Desulfuromonas sp.]